MMFDSCVKVIKFQTACGGVQCILSVGALGFILGLLQKYHDSDRLNFNCDPKPSDFIRQRCYNSYISTVTKPHGLIPRNVVATTLGILCACWISFAIFGAVTLQKRAGDTNNKKTKKFLCVYFSHVIFRILFQGVMLGLVCSYQTISLPSSFKCDVNKILPTNSQTTLSPLNQTNKTLQCNDLHHQEKSNLNKAFISVDAFFMVVSIIEVLHLYRNKGNYVLINYSENAEVGRPLLGLLEKPTITSTEIEVDKDVIVTWSEAEANSGNGSIQYRLECWKQSMTGPTKVFQQGDIVETHLKITGLEYDTEYEVKLFAVNKQGESEADVRRFKTKSGLPEKPTITSTEIEVDKDVIVTWSEAEANSGNGSIQYRLECWKQSMTGPTKVFQPGDIVETHLKITGLEYDTEYEVKLFAVNKQGESEADVRRFKTKSAISRYTKYLQESIMRQTEFQPKLLASRTISNAKTDEIFTNLLIQHGRIDLIRNDETYSRSEKLKYYGEVSGTPVKHCSEIFLGMIDDQESANSILVVGKAGIGKSLFCQKVNRDWANNKLFQARENTEIPNLKFVYLLIFRQFNLLENNSVTLKEILNCCSALNDKCKIDDSTFEYIVKHPKEIMIILDGYDEYLQQDYIAENSEEQHPNDARSEMPVAALFSKLIKGKILQGAIVMITSRPDESDKMGGIRFKRDVEIAGFSTEKIKEYIEKYFKKNENMKNIVLKHVMSNENLVSFAHIPMLCYLLCFEMEYTLTESENPSDLPVSTTDIYTKLIDIFELKHSAESEYREKEIPEQFKTPPVIKNTLDKLSKLAAKLLVERKPTFDEREMEGDFEAEEVSKLKGSGLLYCGQPFRTALITTTKHFSFTHLTVQEFLAARWFVKENRVPDEECSEMVYQFMAGVLSREGNEKLMEKLLDSPFMKSALKMTCLNEYQDKEFAKRFYRKKPQAFCSSGGVMALNGLSPVDYIGVSFVLDSISELNKEEAGEAQHKCSDKFVTPKKLELRNSHLPLSGMQRVYNSLNNEHCLVPELKLATIILTDECVGVINRLVVRKLTTLILLDVHTTETGFTSLCEALQHPSCKLTTLRLKKKIWITNYGFATTGFTSLCKALQHPSCKLTTLGLEESEISDDGFASLCEALQHPSCKLTTLGLEEIRISNHGFASLCEALQHPSCKLTTLGLEKMWISDDGFASLCGALQHPSCKLTTLSLWLSIRADTDVPSLCKVLQHPSCKLTSLNLRFTRVTDFSVAKLCEALQHPSCKLTTLSLINNLITDTGVASLCKALQHPSCKLSTLDLESNIYSDACVPNLCKALQHPSCKLTTLNLGRSGITNTGFTWLCEALKHPSCKLTKLDLESNIIPDTCVASLCEALQHRS